MDGGNITPFALILLLILAIESIIAFLGNGFIIAVNGHRWLQSRKMLPLDLLLTALGTTRFLMQVVTVLNQLFIYSSEFVCRRYLLDSLSSVWIYFSSANIWCATWLSVFYCVKITNISHGFFLWLKLKIDMFVPRLLGLSFTVLSLPFAVSAWRINNYCSPTGNMSGNTSQGEDTNYRLGIFVSLQSALIVINVSICLMASILLLASLWRHTRNLKRSGFATKDFSSQAHINAVNSLLFFLFFYFLYIALLTTFLSSFHTFTTIWGLVANVVQALCPSAHSIVLILTNPKLKEVCVQIINSRQRTS